MKKLVTLLIFLATAAVSAYFSAKLLIIPHIEELEYYHYIIIATLGLSLLLVGVFFVVFLGRNKDKKINQLSTRLKQWTNLSVHVNQAGDDVFKYLPIGILIFDEEQKIKWANNYAKEIFSSDLIDTKLGELNVNIVNYLANKDNTNIITVSDHYYLIQQLQDSRIIYLFDVTKEQLISKKYVNRTLAFAILALDNLEMETKKLDMQETASIHGELLGEISEWVSKYNGYIREIEDDSLIVLFDQEHLKQMINDKFDIVDRIRETSSTNNLRVTLSMGIASGDVSYKELGQYATQAIELAEKRGGDQVVVNILGEKILYFGAKTNALAKNDLLTARSNTLALKDQIESSQEIYIMGHNRADADALGACIGCLRLALSSHKPTHVIMNPAKVDQTCQKILKYISEKENSLTEYFISDEAINDVGSDDLLIVVDTQSPKIAMNSNLIKKFRKLAVIDHHRSSDEGFGETVFSYVEPYASSTVELISEMFQFYQKDNVDITSFEATIMLAGLVVDTNNFTFRTSTRTFESASLLKDAGADMIEIRRLLRNDLDFQMLLSKCIENSEIIMNKFAVCVFEDSYIVKDRTLLAKVADQLLNVDNVEAAFVLANYSDEDEGVAISARSYTDINVQVVMEEMGGGGHLNSAATQIKNGVLIEVKQQLLEILKRDFEAGDEKMKVILLENIADRGNKNDIIEVATGYGNYLVTNKKAKLATEEAIQQLQEEIKQAKIAEENERKMMQKIKADIETKSVNIYIKVGVDGRLYGHVTTKQICEEFEAQTGIHIDKRKVTLPVEIFQLGNYQAVVELYKDIKATFEINVLEK